MSQKFIQIQTALYDKDKALEIGESLVKKRLAGCVQVLGQTDSFYTWKGELIKDKEYLLLIKTKKDLYQKVQQEIRRMHSYKVPELIAMEISDGSKDYLEWLGKVTSDDKI